MTHLVTTTATIHACGRCGQLTLTGTAEGLAAHVDPVALNPDGQAAAILHGRTLYRLNRGQLVHLDQHRIAGSTIPGPTLAVHKCGTIPPPEHRATTEAPPATKTTSEGIPY